MTRPHRRLTELRKLLRHYASRDNDRAREDAATIAWAIGCVLTLEDVANEEDVCMDTWGVAGTMASKAADALGRAIGDQDVAEMVKEVG